MSLERFNKSLPIEYRLSGILVQNTELLSDNLKNFVESNVDSPNDFLSIINTVGELGKKPPVVFTISKDTEATIEEGLSALTAFKKAILPDDLPDLNSEEAELAKIISEQMPENISAKIVEISFKFAIFKNQNKSEHRQYFSSSMSSEVIITNPTGIILELTENIFDVAKAESEERRFMQGNRFDPNEWEYFHDLEKFKKVLRSNYSKLNKKHKRTIKKHGLGSVVRQEFSNQVNWGGQRRIERA